MPGVLSFCEFLKGKTNVWESLRLSVPANWPRSIISQGGCSLDYHIRLLSSRLLRTLMTQKRMQNNKMHMVGSQSILVVLVKKKLCPPASAVFRELWLWNRQLKEAGKQLIWFWHCDRAKLSLNMREKSFLLLASQIFHICQQSSWCWETKENGKLFPNPKLKVLHLYHVRNI